MSTHNICFYEKEENYHVDTPSSGARQLKISFYSYFRHILTQNN